MPNSRVRRWKDIYAGAKRTHRRDVTTWKKEMKTRTTSSSLIALLLACFALPQSTQALLPPPPPDGGYPGANTAEGDGALFNLTTASSTRLSVLMRSTTTQPATSTRPLVKALNNNTTGDDNTANGFQALAGNSTGARKHGHRFSRAFSQHRRLIEHGEWY